MKTLLLLMLFLGGVLTGCGPEKPTAAEQTASNIVAQLIAGDVAAVYQDASVELRRRTSFRDFRYEALQLKADPSSTVSWRSVTSDEGSAALTGEVSRPQGQPARVNLELSDEIGAWRLRSLEISE